VGNAPVCARWQAHAGAAYTFRTGLFNYPRVDASHQTKTFFDVTNTPEIAQLSDITVLNTSLALTPDDEKWRLTLGVNNATDKEYPIAGNSSLTTGSGYAEIAYSRPRQYFALFNIDF
jgi:iron complex outermembrane receptor protein